ncbi:antibiotic biosynthesis monooxygenase [Halomonas campisalis]|uniref:Antibiotic biosynthesis monooxygenase n=1 Tax=Billgrantia campisalis TaxID=74661 RepID=A0ABS9P8L3_9GAMM|nr:putative quinol monooxygenase [Halomonas campisalis]MCG6658118.1 antibiotic biosynthesis monooxygenase [Halomonas campisalis]MDR5862785.1 putative quinol monooxygenase [Halomonas campisalis]
MYCIIVQTRLKPGQRNAFLAAMLPNAAASVREEPGCHVFDVIEDRDSPDLFHLYELYADEAALAAHKQTPHYLACREVVNPLIAEQTVIRADVLATRPRAATP